MMPSVNLFISDKKLTENITHKKTKPQKTGPHSPVHPHENGDPVSLIYPLRNAVRGSGTLDPNFRWDERKER